MYKKVDYIIVGLGIAGITFSKQLLDHNKSFMVLADGLPGATQASGGVFNPIVLRRFTAPEDTSKFIDYANQLYKGIENITSNEWMFPKQEVRRIFASVEEQNDWFTASDKPHLKPFLVSKVYNNNNPSIQADFGLGTVSQSFKIDATALSQMYQDYLLANEKMTLEGFDYAQLIIQEGESPLRYKNLEAKRIVFAEGALVRENPFITTPIIRPNKGEYLIIEAKNLKLDYMLKGAVYIIPLGNDLYKVGATYSRDDISDNPSEGARKQIEEKLKKIILCDYKIINQVTGVRPTTKDHEPILGKIRGEMYIFNGLGSRGFTRGPYYSKLLYDALENKGIIPSTMDVNRFNS